MKKINLIFDLSFLIFLFSQISYAQNNSIMVPEYGTRINKSWDDRFCVGFVEVTKNGDSLGHTLMSVLWSRNTYRNKGSLLIKLPLFNLNINSEIEAKNTIVIGADTIVVQDGKVLGKPKDRANAFEMLHSLQGKAHQVYTGIAVLNYDESGQVNVHNDVVKTEVYVHAMSEEEIKNYIATGECDDKAGGYGIQGKFAVFIEKIEGDYYNVVGLPISHLYQILKTKIC